MGFYCGCENVAEFQAITYPVARKQYRCVECGQAIMPGATYARLFSVYDGSAETFLFCERCNDLGEAFGAVGFCWDIGDLLSAYADWLRDEGKSYPQWLTEIRPRLREAAT